MFDFMDFDASAESYERASGPIVPEPIDCMRCGACLSRCPTYQLTDDEREGPRQRIRTLSRLLVEQQPVDDEAIRHLQNCLECRACEAICPGQMDYAELYDQAQQRLSAGHEKSGYARIALKLIANKPLFNAMVPFIWLYRRSGVRTLFGKLGVLNAIGLSRADKIAPQPVLSSLKTSYSVASARGKVALFTGCISDRFDRATLSSAIRVLNYIGYEVLVPKRQGCCGAIHYHNGEQDAAKQLMRHNLAAFAELSVDAVIYCATGCGSQLQDYPRILEQPADKAQAWQDKLQEVTEFVDRHWPDALTLRSCDKKIVVHEPCSQRNVLNNQQAVYRLLSRIPGCEVAGLEDNQLCCGAGGSYMLTHPEQADALRDLKWRQVQASAADYLVTTNIGCALHLAAADLSKTPVPIVHPVQRIADLL